MYNYDHNQPGPSRHSYHNNYSFYSDYPSRNANNPVPSAADRLRESHRGARQSQSYNPNFQQNANMMHYPHNQWTPHNNQRTQPPIQNQQKDKKREYNNTNRDKHNRPQHQQSRTYKNSNTQVDNDHKPGPAIISKEIDYKLYKCPSCSLQFDCLSRYNSFVGRVPLILNCKHTVCQECIPKMAKDNTVLCPVCKNPSVLPPRYSVENLQDIFFPNFFLIGFIMWCKTQGTNPNFTSLVPAHNINLSRKSKSPVPSVNSSQQSGETCCFLSCNKMATLNCPDCSDVYCAECCTAIHKSAKSLWSHKQVPIAVSEKKATLELEKCSEHNMDVEFYCTTCNTESCCYCFLEQHEGHTKENLAKLSDGEMQEFKSNKENARKLLKQLLISQRRLKSLYVCNTTNVEKKISNYFMNLHAKLQCIEKNLKKEIANYSTENTSLPDIDDLNSTLTKSIENLSSIVVACDALDVKKMNLREMSKRLNKVQNLPCYLLSDGGKGLEPLEFDVEDVVDNLEEFFAIKKNEKCDYKLVAEEDLPSDYEKDSADLQYESDVESCISSLNKRALSDDIKIKKKSAAKSAAIGSQVALENEMVEVTHIESLECFYVQLKKTQYQFSQLNRDITDYIKMGAPTVDHPQLNELYLVMYQTRNEKIWCRGRVTEIKNGEMEPLYEVFFIDYGSTQTVDVLKLRQITPALAHKKPFATHCQLYNPSMANWAKNAHVYMGKMINGKQISMLVKGVQSGVHQVDLMVMSSDRGQTSIIDILIHTCSNALSNSDNESVSSQKLSFNRGCKIFGNSIEFKKFQQERVIIVNVIDPHHIFVHIAAHAESLKKMNNMLKQTYKSSKKSSCLPIEGSFVIVDYKDVIRGNWHRGFIKKVDVTGEKCHVLLIDWGLNITVPWSSIRLIQEEFTRLESQAILVKLAHVEPLDKSTVWVDAATVFLQKYYRSQEIMKIIVHEVDPLEVALFEVVGDMDICINTQLVVESYAESTGKISQTLEWPRNDAEIKKFTDDDGLVGSLLKKVESFNEESDDDDEQKDVVRQKIEVVKFVSPDLIYIKFSMFESQEMSLNKELQIHYNNERTTKPSWAAEELCVVMYDLSYARGRILEKVAEKKYKVNVYDRGAEVVMPLEKIFEYAKYFNKFPNVVFKSHLANIRPAGGNTWSLSSTEALERMFDKYKDIYGTRVEGDITGKSIPMHMWYMQVKIGEALEASVTKFISLNNLLVKLGYAYRLPVADSGKSGPGSVKSGTGSVHSGKGSSKSGKGSVKSGRSKSSRSNKSNKSNQSSPLLSALEKIANTSAAASEVGTDQESTISDLKDEILDLPGYDSSVSETRSEVASLTSSRSATRSSTVIEKVGSSGIDWNELIEEEEKIKRSKSGKSAEDSPYHTQETDIEDWIPAFPIKETEFCAWITCAETGGILYLREEKLQNVYKEMEQNIKEYFDKKPSNSIQHTWQPGQLCTIHYKDHYYRGKVHKVNGPDDIAVIMIDFGSDHKLTDKDLNREILYPKIPAFASKIKLDRVYPKCGSWLDSDYETFLQTVSEYSKIIIKSSLDQDIPTAEVFTDKGVNVNQTVVQKCPNLTRSEPKQEHNSDDDDGVVIEEEEAIVEEDEQLTVEIHHVQVHQADNGAGAEKCDAEKEDPVEAGPPTDTTKYKYKILDLSEKESDDKIAVSVMSVLEYNKVALKETATLTSEFFQLGERMQTAVKLQPVIQTLEDGMPCVCPFSEDGAWYRAQIYNMEGLDCGYVFVFFVDFGNVESVAVGDIRMMRPDWFDFPVSCHIADVNIELVSDKNSQHVTQHMKKLYGKNKYAKIIRKRPLCVNLYESSGELCYASLLEKGLVKLKE